MQESFEVAFSFLVTVQLRRHVLQAFSGVFVAFERLGNPHRIAVAHGAVTA